MASESQITRSPSLSTGTWPDGEWGAIASAVASPCRSSTTVSRKSAPVRFSASHGRSDQLDQARVPMTISMGRLLRGRMTGSHPD